MMRKVLFVAVLALIVMTAVGEENAGRFAWDQTPIDLGEIGKKFSRGRISIYHYWKCSRPDVKVVGKFSKTEPIS